MKRLILSLLFCAFSTGPVFSQQDFSTVQIVTHKVGGNVHYLEGSGGNIGVSVGSDGVLIVDDQYLPLADKINTALGNLKSGDLKFVLNTHHHGDHTGGNPYFGKMATIVAHQNVLDRVSKGDNAIDKAGWPVITYDRSASVHFNGEQIELVHYSRGHTDGDAIVYFKGSNVVHMGD
ncbi:MAG: MBL fold metallo-hydrolase, partial [Candidatus Latescibacteria bacterium]|nr:MBL fold metallo-hydrolase [Candidatus Latescibacterota bacterium]